MTEGFTAAAMVGAIALIIVQHVLLLRAKERWEQFYEAMRDVANGDAHMKIDHDGDLCIKAKKEIG
jgi:hypothetical protein